MSSYKRLGKDPDGSAYIPVYMSNSLHRQGYTMKSVQIVWFWDVLLSLSHDLQKKFLHFATGSDRVPIGGMKKLKFKITRSRSGEKRFVLK